MKKEVAKRAGEAAKKESLRILSETVTDRPCGQ